MTRSRSDSCNTHNMDVPLNSMNQNPHRDIRAVTLDQDTLALARTGKKQVLKRRFGLLSMIGLSCSTLISWEAILSDMGIGLQNGGPAGLLYGAVVTWLGTASVVMAMGELSSMLPTAGGQYHWANILAPPSYRRLLSYITGWWTVVAWIAAPTATAYLTATLMQELISLNIPAYNAEPWQATLIMWAVLLVAVFLNTILGFVLPAMEVAFLCLHILGFFAVLIPLANLGPRGNTREIFTTFFNKGGWSTNALAFFVGMQGNVTAMLGSDSAIHMSEEVQRADVNVARSMVISVFINGAQAFGILVAFVFTAGPLQELVDSGSQYPFINILISGTGSTAAAATLTAVVIIMNFFACVSATSSGSRMVWSFARDQGLPFWRQLRKVGRQHSIPTIAILVVAACGALLGLIQIGSPVAFEDVLSIAQEAWMSSYICCLVPLMYHRVVGNIAVPDDRSSHGSMPPLGETSQLHHAIGAKSALQPGGETVTTISGTDFSTNSGNDRPAPFVWGPWRIPGIWGTLNNAFALLYLFVFGFFGYWPPFAEVSATTMNYSSLILGAVAIASAAYYAVWARKTYRGPIIEVQMQSVDDGRA